jgi:hypothetical protein
MGELQEFGTAVDATEPQSDVAVPVQLELGIAADCSKQACGPHCSC